jgi:hypothetical protein
MTDNKNEKIEDSKLSRTAKIALIFGASPIIILLAIGIVTLIINENFGNRECWFEREYLDLNFHGTIQAKGFDQENHNYPYIDIVNSRNSIEHIFLIFKEEQLWNKLELKDYINKQKGNLNFEIKRDTVTFTLTPAFDCGTDDFWIKF